MSLRKELRQRLAKEYRRAATTMELWDDPARKLFYFSAVYGEAQRILNLEWNRDLALVHMVAQQAYNQINIQSTVVGKLLPITWTTIGPQLTKATADLATHFEKQEDEGSRERLCEILGRIAEITYASTGNGSYLYEKGDIKF